MTEDELTEIEAALAGEVEVDYDIEDSVHCLIAEVRRLRQWVNDLQSGMTVNCVYCGHCYGPAADTPVSMADVLKQHIERCPEHPMSRLRAEVEARERAAFEAGRSEGIRYGVTGEDPCITFDDWHLSRDKEVK